MTTLNYNAATRLVEIRNDGRKIAVKSPEDVIAIDSELRRYVVLAQLSPRQDIRIPGLRRPRNSYQYAIAM